MEIIGQLLINLDANSSTVSQVEVPLQLLIVLGPDLPAEFKKPDPSNKYYQIIEWICQQDVLNQWPCIYNHAFALEKYIEMMRNWTFFFEGDQISQMILGVFFSDKTITNKNPSVVQMTCQSLNRTYHQRRNDILPNLETLQRIAENSILVIDHLN